MRYPAAMAEIRIGIVGSGFLAETRARCWEQVRGARVVAVASRQRAGADAFATKHGIPQAFDSAEALFGSDIDVADLCVPNRIHRPLTEAAAAAGKHVICTKPLSAYVGQDLDSATSEGAVGTRDPVTMFQVATDDARAMNDACASASITLCYGENWVYAPGVVRAAGLLESAGAALLEMRGWECHSGSHSPYAKAWRNTGGGALLRLGAHPVGAMLHLKRLEAARTGAAAICPVAVTAETTDLSQVAGATAANTRIATGWQDVENWGCAVIHFSDGSRGIATGSDNVLGGMESRLEIYASNCQVKCNLSPSDGVRAYAPDGEVFGDRYLQEKLDTGAGWSTPMLDEDWTSGQLPMCQAFADALATGSSPASDGALGLDVTRVIYAGYVSAREGRRVTLDELEAAG